MKDAEAQQIEARTTVHLPLDELESVDLPFNVALTPPYTSTPAPDGKKPSVKWPQPDENVLARAREMSPMTYIRRGLPPTFIVYGDLDRTVDPRQDLRLKRALDEAGVPNSIHAIVGRGHGGFKPEENDTAKLLCLKFLKAHGILR